MKKCWMCGLEKLTEEFYKDKNRKDGFTPICKVCSNEYRTKFHVKRKYRLSPEDHVAKEVEQNNLCAICKRPETAMRNGKFLRLSIDHNHITGEMRELLCSKCNVLIGMSREDILILLSAIDYLKRHS